MKKNPPFTTNAKNFHLRHLNWFPNWQFKTRGRSLAKNLRASLFNDDIWKETSFSLIHLAGQYVPVDGKVGWLKKVKNIKNDCKNLLQERVILSLDIWIRISNFYNILVLDPDPHKLNERRHWLDRSSNNPITSQNYPIRIICTVCTTLISSLCCCRVLPFHRRSKVAGPDPRKSSILHWHEKAAHNVLQREERLVEKFCQNIGNPWKWSQNN